MFRQDFCQFILSKQYSAVAEIDNIRFIQIGSPF